MAAMVRAYLVLFLSLSPSLFSLSSGADEAQDLVSEIHEMKLKISQLEFGIDTTNQELNAKSLHIEKCEKTIEELTNQLHHLESVLSDLKGPFNEEEELLQLNKEVQDLAAVTKKNDGDLRRLEFKAKDSESRMKVLASEVERMANIVAELWIHVQKLEQAVQVIERRTYVLRTQIRNARCTFFKFIRRLSGRHQSIVMGWLDPFFSGKGSSWSFYTSKALDKLKGVCSGVKMYHHQLQGFVKQELEKNEFTAALADDEIVFFVASALIVFPVVFALLLLSSQWS